MKRNKLILLELSFITINSKKSFFRKTINRNQISKKRDWDNDFEYPKMDGE